MIVYLFLEPEVKELKTFFINKIFYYFSKYCICQSDIVSLYGP